jgi:16S rRNA processing protein RimM
LRKNNPQDGPSGSASGSAELQPQDSRDALLRIGRVVGAHGLVGALRVRPDNPDGDAFAQVDHVYLEIGDTVNEYKLLTASRANRSSMKILLEGISDADAAEKLRGAEVLVAKADLPPAQPGEFYYYQVVGCEVVTTDGQRLGVVEEVFSNGANDVWVVRDGKTEVLVPVIADVVKTIDLDAHMITVEAVPGLLD